MSNGSGPFTRYRQVLGAAEFRLPDSGLRILMATDISSRFVAVPAAVASGWAPRCMPAFEVDVTAITKRASLAVDHDNVWGVIASPVLLQGGLRSN